MALHQISTTEKFQILPRFGEVLQPSKQDDIYWKTPKRNSESLPPSVVVDENYMYVLAKEKTKSPVAFKFKSKKHADAFMLLVTNEERSRTDAYPREVSVKSDMAGVKFILNKIYQSSTEDVLYSPATDNDWNRPGVTFSHRSFSQVLLQEISLLQDLFIVTVSKEPAEEKISPSLEEFLEENSVRNSLRRLDNPLDAKTATTNLLWAPVPKEDSFISASTRKNWVRTGNGSENPNTPIPRRFVTFDKEYNLLAKLYKKEVKSLGFKLNVKGAKVSMPISSWQNRLRFLQTAVREKPIIDMFKAVRNILENKTASHTGLIQSGRVSLEPYAPEEFKNKAIGSFGRSSNYRAHVSKAYSDFFLKTIKTKTFQMSIKNVPVDQQEHAAGILFFPILTLIWKMYGQNQVTRGGERVATTDQGTFERYFEDLFTEINRTKAIPINTRSAAFARRSNRIIKKLR